MCAQPLSRVRLFATSLSVEFSRQECWSGLPFPTPGDLSKSGIELASLASPRRFFTTGPPGKPLVPYRDGAVSLVVVSVDFEVILIPFGCSLYHFYCINFGQVLNLLSVNL